MAEIVDKTAFYQGLPGLPPLVVQAVALARKMSFPWSCTVEQGELLRLLARGREGGLIGVSGTGCGVGLAWMVEAVGPATKLISVEIDAARAGDTPADPSALLKPAGTMVLDVFHPPMERWPPLEQGAGEDSLGRNVDRARAYWFDHPNLLTTEVRVHPMVSAVIGTRRGS